MIHRKKIQVIALGAALIAGGAVWYRLATHRVEAQAPLGPYVPYTSVLREQITDAKGAIHSGSVEMFAVRSDGTLFQRLGSSANASRTIHFASGQQVRTAEKSGAGTKTTVAIPVGPRTWLADPARSCAYTFEGQPFKGKRLAGEEQVDGYRTAKLVDDVVTEWRALDYGCAMVRYRAGWQQGGSSDHRLVSLTRGEPAPELFDLDGLVEKQPSALSPAPSKDCDADCQAKQKMMQDLLNKR